METIDRFIQYSKSGDIKLLVENTNISQRDLNIVIIEILDWLRLEHKRTIWKESGKNIKLKSLSLNTEYPWCNNLSRLVKNEEIFKKCFMIKDNKFDFNQIVEVDLRKEARKKVYDNYCPKAMS